MMTAMTIFWTSFTIVAYTYVIYPVAVAAAARWRPVRRGTPGTLCGRVSVIVAAYNEAGSIARRVVELARQLASGAVGGEVIVVSDGSTDGTAQEAQSAGEAVLHELDGRVPVRVLDLAENQGKAVALNEGVAAATAPILVFADARQRWAPDAIDRLVENFADPAVGAVSGELVVESAPGVMAGVGLYWRFEKWLRRAESRFRSMVSVTGSIAAVRRELYSPIPPGTLLDDVYWPLVIAMSGTRVVHDERAVAYDRLPERPRDEFRRKVRTLAGNFQLMTLLPSALLPWRNRAWWQFASHRVLRLAVPWALLAMLISGGLLGGRLYSTFTLAQVAFYLVGATGLQPGIASRSRLVSGASSFLVLNAAAWVAFWVWAAGRSTRSWSKVSYREAADGRSA